MALKMNICVLSIVSVLIWGTTVCAAPVRVPSTTFAALYSAKEGQVQSVPATNGRADGVNAGRRDRQGNYRFNFASHADYKNGLRGYDPKLGDRKAYKKQYRSAYENGYREGWNGY
jgi:hypothetical protein